MERVSELKGKEARRKRMEVRRLRANRLRNSYDSLPRKVKMVAVDYFAERPKQAPVSAPTGRKRPAVKGGERGIGHRFMGAKKEEEEPSDHFCSRRGRARSLSVMCLCEQLCRFSKPTTNPSPNEKNDMPKGVVSEAISWCRNGVYGYYEKGSLEEDERKMMYEKLFGREEYPPRSDDEDDDGGGGGGCSTRSQQRIQEKAGRELCRDVTTGYGENLLRTEVGVACSSARNGEGSDAAHGSVAVCGRRREMEDAVTLVPGFFSDRRATFDFFAVYDGHGGAQVAEFCNEMLHRVLAEEMERSDAWELPGSHEEGWGGVMRSCFRRIDAEVERKTVATSDVRGGRTSGSTAVVAVVGGHYIVVANCGDSRAVLGRAGSAVPLSFDHKPDRADEMERVEGAGGRIISCDGYRVLGVLATSRSLAGDGYLKPYVISEPEVTISNRTTKDEFLVLASDGLWDVISNELACRVVRRCLSGSAKQRLLPTDPPAARNKAALAAATLTEIALGRGSEDNISVVVVDLRPLSKRSRT